jgi:type I restriction enzyme M protein
MPEKGKKADLMFVQHMLAVLKSDGKMATVMPHGVLFRGGERSGTEHFIERGWLEAVIGLPAGLFYGTGIPACVLVMNKKDAATASMSFSSTPTGNTAKARRRTFCGPRTSPKSSTSTASRRMCPATPGGCRKTRS